MKLKEIMVRTGDSALPLMMEANRLGIDGWIIRDIKIIKGGDIEGDVMVVEVYGEKIESHEMCLMSECEICNDETLVCENHPNKAWNSLGCMCGAGMPCICSHLHRSNWSLETKRHHATCDAKNHYMNCQLLDCKEPICLGFYAQIAKELIKYLDTNESPHNS